jgi:excisionase family DNA binding protein
MKHQKPQHDVTPLFFTRKEAARYFSISEPQLDGLLRAGTVPHVRLGIRRLVRIPRSTCADKILANIGKTLAPARSANYKSAVGVEGDDRNAAAESLSPAAVGAASHTGKGEC